MAIGVREPTRGQRLYPTRTDEAGALDEWARVGQRGRAQIDLRRIALVLLEYFADIALGSNPAVI
jgi:hypothetical protein